MQDAIEFLVISFGGLFLLALLVAAIRICWIDAKKRGKSPILVCIIAIWFFPLGTVIWLLFRPEPLDGPGTEKPFRLQDYRVQ